MVIRFPGRPAWPIPLCVGLALGAAVAAVDNVALDGEVSPVVTVAMLFAMTATAGLVWRRRAWVMTAAVWVWVPGAHLAKRILGLPDTLHPNTYTSILMLALFSLVVAATGTGCGLLLRRLIPKKAIEVSAY